MTTHVDLAPAKTSGKVYSIPVTAADLNRADYAAGLPAFTLNVGDVILASWVTIDSAFDQPPVMSITNADGSVGATITDAGAVSMPQSFIGPGQDTAFRIFAFGATQPTSGTGTAKVYVLPGS